MEALSFSKGGRWKFMLFRLFNDSCLLSSPHFFTCSCLLFNCLLLSFKVLLHLAILKLIAGADRGKESHCLTSSDKKWCEFHFLTVFFSFFFTTPVSWGKEQGELPQGMRWKNYLSHNSHVLWGSDILSNIWFLQFLSKKVIIKGWLKLNCLLSVYRTQENKPTTLNYIYWKRNQSST